MGSVIVPFMTLETAEDYDNLEALAGKVIDSFTENDLEHERIGETIDRIGLVNFLDGIGIDVDINMVRHPRTNSFVRTDDFDEEAEKWRKRHKAKVDAPAAAAE
jgi:sulfite reductase alpha subunit